MRIRHLVPAISFALACAGPAQADEDYCGPDPAGKSCPTGSYSASYKNGCSKMLCNNEAPPSITVECTTGFFGQYYCETWPQAEGASYAWSSSGLLSVTPWGPTASVVCTGDGHTVNGGAVSVIFTSPGGATNNGWTGVSCEEEIEN